MPKMKTISAAKKRFRVNAGGKIKRPRAYQNHCLEHKSAKQGRRLRTAKMLDASNVRQIKRMLLVG
jgi:large subunit ribosomal protein L35